ncbi:MAG: hypothetical protein KAV87_49195 [Desulfobacteraceae bacterium]|nr:hypothetical protein [Desulfobacteraceae bacterium]
MRSRAIPINNVYLILGGRLLWAGLAVGMTSAQAGLIHHWKLDEDTAAGDTIAADSVGGR